MSNRNCYQVSRRISAILLFTIITTVLLSANVHSQTFKFDFGSGAVADGYTRITPQTKFTTTLGYGIDSGNVTSVDRGGGDALRSDYLTTTDELFFSVVVPQGNYDITVIFGDVGAASATTVKAENRRLLFDRVQTAAGGFVGKTITVRKMEAKSIDGSVTMTLKDRELGYYTWDASLTLRFSGKKPAVCGVEIKKADAGITLFLCGNSTVVDQLDAPWCSWGQMLPMFLSAGVAVANHAESGLTAGNFLSMKRLTKLLTEVKKGDYVFVEFGHNDQKSTTDVTNYSANLKTFRDQIVAKKATPVFVAPTARQTENDPLTSIGGLAQTMRETAQALGVACIDLNQMVIDLKKALGSDTKYLYMFTESDQTHFCEYGGYELARCMLRGIEEKIPALKSTFIAGYTTFNPSKPDPLDYLTIDLPTGAGLHEGMVARQNPVYSIKIAGATLIAGGTLHETAELSVYGIDGREIGTEVLRFKNASTCQSPVLLQKLARGAYVLYLLNRGAVTKSVIYYTR